MYSLRELSARTFGTIDQVLTGSPANPIIDDTRQSFNIRLRTAALIVLIAGLCYGSAMGCYAALANQRAWTEQWLQLSLIHIYEPTRPY